MNVLLKSPLRLMFFLLAIIVLCVNCATVACADEIEAESEDIVVEALVEDAEETVAPVIDEIPDDLYQAYVLACLFFFVVVIVFHYAYKFFAMFF